MAIFCISVGRQSIPHRYMENVVANFAISRPDVWNAYWHAGTESVYLHTSRPETEGCKDLARELQRYVDRAADAL